MQVFDAIDGVFPEIIHRDHIFGVLIGNGQQGREFPIYRLVAFELIRYLNIDLFSSFFCNKINLFAVEFTNKDLKTPASEFKKNDVFQHAGNHSVAITHGSIEK